MLVRHQCPRPIATRMDGPAKMVDATVAEDTVPPPEDARDVDQFAVVSTGVWVDDVEVVVGDGVVEPTNQQKKNTVF